MPKPKTKDLARRGTETTTQRVKMQMRDAAGRDVSPESYGGDTIEDSAQYIVERTADGIREAGSSIKDKAMVQIKERIERVRQREDAPDSGNSAPQEPQSGRSYSEPRTDGPQDRPVDASLDPAPDRSPRQKPEGAERIKTKDSYLHSQREAAAPKEIHMCSDKIIRLFHCMAIPIFDHESTSASRSITARLERMEGWTYRSSVIFTLACPRISLRVLGSHPCSMHRVAKLWRRAWKV